MMTLLLAIADDPKSAMRLLAKEPALATATLEAGATRQQAKPYFLDAIAHHVYTGDTALHVAAAAHSVVLIRRLVRLGADVHATNRRGHTPLHYATRGGPGSPSWNPRAQAAAIAALIAAGADPNAVDDNGSTPLHRAVRNRCAAAVRALLDGGADPRRKNGGGSTAKQLATMTTGKGGSGTAAAKVAQAEILRLLGHISSATSK
ncbi:MAG TPA: ankyrin repeat domain-containing protein [Kofleriaceae bacterium]|nr:ankyrin repeat domain-containing protein [Kofleriaceae bacterium]